MNNALRFIEVREGSKISTGEKRKLYQTIKQEIEKQILTVETSSILSLEIYDILRYLKKEVSLYSLKELVQLFDEEMQKLNM